MDVISHALTYFEQCNGDIDKFKANIAYVLEPDAIRFYTGNREYSHFEENQYGEVSYMAFPENLKELSKDKIDEYKKNKQMVLADDIKKAAIGEETHIEKFLETNSSLPKENFEGILNHLIQDKTYDAWIRQMFDCTNKYNDKYFDQNNNVIDGSTLRSQIRNIEISNNLFLIDRIEEKYNIKINQDWIDNNVKESLKEVYEHDMFENTKKFLTLESREKVHEIYTEQLESSLKELSENVQKNTEAILNDIKNNEPFKWPDDEKEIEFIRK